MRLLQLCVLFGVTFLLMAAAPLSAGDYTGRAPFTADNVSFGQKAGFDVVNADGLDLFSEPGKPVLPCLEINVALPTGAEKLQLASRRGSKVVLAEELILMPGTQPRRISNPPAGNPFFMDPAVYESDALYPAETAKIVSTWDLYGQEFVTIRLFPFQYSGATGTLYLSENIAYQVSYDVDTTAVRRTYNFSKTIKARNLARLQRMAVNPAAVSIPAFTGAGSRALPAGQYDHVIITNTFESQWAPLSELYTKLGVPSNIVTLSYIYSNYSGSGNDGKIQNFVDDAHGTWGTTYFLLGGDEGEIPYNTYSSLGDNIPDDTYYSDYDDDWTCEVNVGRAPVDTTTEVADFITKTEEYITYSGLASGFGDEVFGMGFDLDNSTDGEDLMIDIYNNYVPAWADYDREYDSEGGGHESDVKSYINGGENVTFHADHCWYDSLGVGSYNHGTHLSNSECSAFTNSTRYGIHHSLGCWPGAYDYDCWSERWMRDTNGGGVGMQANSRYGWYNPGTMNTYSARYEKRCAKALYDYNDFHAGEMLAGGKNDYYPGDSYYKYIFKELNLQGDPAVPIWTDVPGSFSCTYSTSISTGSQTYSVNVKQGGSNYSGALVCLYMGSQVYATATTNASGNVDISINPTSGGTMYVSATDQNMIPHMGTCTVGGGGGSDLTVDLVLSGTSFQRRDWVYYDCDVTNTTGYSQSTYLWTNVTLPNSNTYPKNGYLDGPMSLSLSAYETQTWNFSRRVPPLAPIGSYVFNAFVGPNPGIEDEDHENFSVTN